LCHFLHFFSFSVPHHLGFFYLWKEAMATFAVLARPFLERFQALLSVALPEDAPLVRFMVVHEGSVIRIAQREAAGDECMDHELIPMLSFPLVRHHPVA